MCLGLSNAEKRLLARLVQLHPAMYDKLHPNYADKQLKRRVWIDIARQFFQLCATEFNMESAKLLYLTWDSMMNQYKRAKEGHSPVKHGLDILLLCSFIEQPPRLPNISNHEGASGLAAKKSSLVVQCSVCPSMGARLRFVSLPSSSLIRRRWFDCLCLSSLRRRQIETMCCQNILPMICKNHFRPEDLRGNAVVDGAMPSMMSNPFDTRLSSAFCCVCGLTGPPGQFLRLPPRRDLRLRWMDALSVDEKIRLSIEAMGETAAICRGHFSKELLDLNGYPKEDALPKLAKSLLTDLEESVKTPSTPESSQSSQMTSASLVFSSQQSSMRSDVMTVGMSQGSFPSVGMSQQSLSFGLSQCTAETDVCQLENSDTADSAPKIAADQSGAEDNDTIVSSIPHLPFSIDRILGDSSVGRRRLREHEVPSLQQENTPSSMTEQQIYEAYGVLLAQMLRSLPDPQLADQKMQKMLADFLANE